MSCANENRQDSLKCDQTSNIYPEDYSINVNPEIYVKISRINHEIFKNQRFRSFQAVAIEAALQRKNLLVLMPNGCGKSLIYQISGYIENKITVIISPSISHIKDQINRLEQVGLNAIFINGNTSEYSVSEIKNNKILFIFITAENLTSSMNFLLKLYSEHLITRFVIDGANRISQLGGDFRPSFTNLKIIKERFESIPIMALTVTVTANIKADIIKELNITDCTIFQMTSNRPNLIYEVWEKEPQKKSYNQVLKFINDHHFEDKSGLIFCMSTNDAVQLSEWLNSQGLNTSFYHGLMKNFAERNNVQQLWSKGEVKILVVTLAFGVEIDKSDVRFVIHYNIPKSIDEYYHESGKAGRDGLLSVCLLLFNLDDKQRVEKMIPMNGKHHEAETKLFKEMVDYCINKCTCRHTLILKNFGEDSQQCNEFCDNCIHRMKSLLP